MAVPKRRMSKSRTAKRRANWKLSVPNLSECNRCHTLKPSHVVCPNCGYYRNREAMAVE